MRLVRLAMLLLPLLSLPTLARAIELRPIASGLSAPVFAGHAGDGSNRLFIVEQQGSIRVLAPGGTSAATFLDIRARVVAGGERGLLGLAFHPLYRSNGRLFVFYTRIGDGALVVAEYGVSADRNVASTTERVLLVIPHPVNANHNGGMLAFGPGGYLFIGVGDGGAANDPPNNAQNLESLLGKILRIDVDQPDARMGLPYSSPASNPFVGRDGRDEIFAYGLRNPWRFSFDRATDQMWVADVGQGAREEVNTPVLAGANFGWRVFEGNACTNLDAALCRPENYVRPLIEYAHTGGRCSITGGYAYRGTAATLTLGTYLYADFCTGEIFGWDGMRSQLLLRTSAVSSFGEDEQGELYVVTIGGTVNKLVTSACSATIFPAATTLSVYEPSGQLTVDVAAGCRWDATSLDDWIRITSSASGTGPGIVTFSVRYLGHRQGRTGAIDVSGRRVTITQSR